MRIIFFFLFSTIATSVLAQWNPNGATTGPIYYTGGNVGIGTSTPVSTLEVSGTISMVRGNRLQFLEAVGGASRAFIESDASNNLKFHIGSGAGTDAMNLDGTGNLGLGIMAPMERLHVNGLIRIPVATATDDDSPGITSTSNDDFLFDGEYINQYGFGFHNHNIESYNAVNSYISGHFGIDMFTQGQHRLRVNRNGNVGIGTTTPNAKLHVVGSGASASPTTNVGVLSSVSGATDPFGAIQMTNDPNYGANYFGARARDNSGSLGAVLQGDVLTGLYGRGYTGTGWSNGMAAIRFIAAQDFATGLGTQIEFGTTANGGTSRSTRMIINHMGNVGIGAINPQARLHVKNGYVMASDGTYDNINVRIDGSSIPTIRFSRWTGSGSNTHNAFIGQFVNANAGNQYSLGIGTGQSSSGDQAATTHAMTILLNGNVGVGTTSPSSKLAVDGTVNCEEVKVEIIAGTGPDYVFEPTYNLPTLAETEAYIKANKHLPEVPSAKEMEANGINLSEMNMLLLKKVEELTLHVIEANKRIERSEQHNAEQQKEIELLKSKIKQL